MRISKIAIRNWRSVKDLEFYPTDITALIGANNAGKTSILSALSFLLGERWPSANSLQDTDFFEKDRSRELQISTWFEDAPENIGRLWFTSRDGRAYYSYLGEDRAYALNQVRREQFPLVYLDATRSYESTFSSSQWSLFGRIIRELDAHFRTNQPPEVHDKVRRLLGDAQGLLRTELYERFEASIVEAFAEQVRLTTHQVRFDFRTFDPLNFYKTLHPILVEQSIPKSPAEVGSGMRNLIVLALFRAYASVLKGGAIIAIEEPEIYLHPHAQRSLATLFEELAAGGSQVLYSTHSPTFVDVARADRIVLVERCEDDEEEVCTKVCTTTSEDLLAARQRLHPGVAMTVRSIRERYRMLCGPEHAGAYFGRVVVIVEGPTEAAAFAVFAPGLDLDIDARGVTIVPAGGKTNIDSLYQLYVAHDLSVFVVFDSDTHKPQREREWNRVLTRMLGAPETDSPVPGAYSTYAVLDGDYERAMRSALDDEEPGLYEQLYEVAVREFGPSKPLIARFMASELVRQDTVPDFIRDILFAIRVLAGAPVQPAQAEDL